MIGRFQVSSGEAHISTRQYARRVTSGGRRSLSERRLGCCYGLRPFRGNNDTEEGVGEGAVSDCSH